MTPHQFSIKPILADYTNETLIAELKRVAKKLNKKGFTGREFEQTSKFKVGWYKRRFKNWNSALQEAVLTPVVKFNVSDKEILDDLARVYLVLGRQPTKAEFNEHSDYSAGLLSSRFGGIREAMKKLSKPKSVLSPRMSANGNKVRIVTKTKKNTNELLSRKIFIVHGHRRDMTDAVARTINKLGFSEVILKEKASGGKNILSKFLDYAKDVSYAIVLLTPDDEGRLLKEKKFMKRARQNVVLELGYFIGTLGADHVFALLDNSKGEIEIPSDYKGILFKEYDGPDGTWTQELIRELRSLGFDVNLNNYFQ
jgi:predicted nucleotide-binding protein